MSNLKEIASTLRIAAEIELSRGMSDLAGRLAGHALQLEQQADSDNKRYDESMQLQAIGKSAMSSIADMVAALECDYDRLAELRELAAEVKEHLDAGNDPAYYDMTADDKAELTELEEAAGDCESREDAEQRIQEDPLSIEVRTGWYAPVGSNSHAEEFQILLSTGGPATRIMGELNEHGEPTRAWIQAQDWFKPWTDYIGGDQETLLTYCRCFYFGEG